MKHATLLFGLVLSLIQSSVAKTIIVDKFGLGQYTTIQAGINAALVGDTVKVYPGVYTEQVNVGKDIVLQGSGYEYTQIVANADPAVSMSSGKMMWFAISSNIGRGVTMSGGTLTNCVVWNSAQVGIMVTSGTTAIIQNCDVVNNNISTSYGGYYCQVYASGGTMTVLNTIVLTTPGGDSGHDIILYAYGATANMLYCRTYFGSGTGAISANPQFTSSTNYRLASSSPCVDAGKPDIYDPDGSRSDMGYYGGPDAPVFPVVTDLRIFLNSDGTVSVQATAQSRY